MRKNGISIPLGPIISQLAHNLVSALWHISIPLGPIISESESNDYIHLISDFNSTWSNYKLCSPKWIQITIFISIPLGPIIRIEKLFDDIGAEKISIPLGPIISSPAL